MLIAFASPLWQLAHLAVRTGWMARSQGTPFTALSLASSGFALVNEPPDSPYAVASTRCARGSTRLTAPVSTLVGMPGASVAAFVRFSWQPPQKRCSPARPLIQTDSFARLIANLSISWMWNGHVARNHRRERVVGLHRQLAVLRLPVELGGAEHVDAAFFTREALEQADLRDAARGRGSP